MLSRITISSSARGVLLILLLTGGVGLQAQLPWYTLKPPTNLQVEGVECVAYLTWEKPEMLTDFIVTDIRPRTNMPDPTVEYSPFEYTIEDTFTDAIWDILFSWSGTDASRPGIEADMEYVYLSAWQSGFGAPPWFQKYEKITGIFVEGFDIQGVSAIRDMASDGTYFYGSNAASTLYQMDFAGQTLVSSWGTGASDGIRHISYDPNLDGGNGGFWCGNWSDMKAIAFDGTLLWNGPSVTSCYGNAFDNQSVGEPYLWTYTQTGAGSADLTQYSIAYSPLGLTATGVTFNVGSVPGASGSAGGVCTDPVGAKYAVICNIQQAPQFVVALELCDYTGGGGTPPGLLGYRIYRDGAYLAYVSGEDTTWYYDFSVIPGVHTYSVSAYYDLMEYDYPGFFDESVPIGPEEHTVICSMPPYLCEYWDMASFAYNQWEFYPSQGNWSITTLEGNPVPAATFSGTPTDTNYSNVLMNFHIRSWSFTCAAIHVDYDIRLDDIISAGTENMVVDLFYDNVWHYVNQFTNSGSFGWEHHHHEFPDASGGISKIRFRAFGENSANIASWYLDNICVVPVCNPPVDPAGEYNGLEVILTWHPPVCNQNIPISWLPEEIHYHSDNPDTASIQYFDWVYGTLFDLSEYQNVLLHEIDFHHVSWGYPCNWKYRIHVVDWSDYMGNSELATVGPFFTSGDGGWEEGIPLDSINAPCGGTVGIFLQPMGLAPDNAWPQLSSDNATPQSLSLFGSFPDYESLSPSSNGNYLINLRILVPDTSKREGMLLNPDATTQEVFGYFVYRSLDTLMSFTKLNQLPVPDTLFVDIDPPASSTATFYYITALFDDAACESVPSDTVEVLVTSTAESTEPVISVFPNPATDLLQVTGEYLIDRIEIFSYLGRQERIIRRINAMETEIDVSGLSPGIYIVNIWTGQGLRTVKIVVVR